MGCPTFKIREYTDPANVIKLSARHVIYRDISERIMTIIRSESENVQVYSVDEAFFTLPYENDMVRNTAFAVRLVQRIKDGVGVPVSIGIAPNKTLAKIAAETAKKDLNNITRVHSITSEQERLKRLENMPVGDVWGVGRKIGEALRMRNVNTALQLSQLPVSLVRSLFNVNVERTVRELRGEDCVVIQPISINHKSIMHSRTFAHVINKRNELNDAIVSFAEACSTQLRAEHSVAAEVMIYLRGDHFRQDLPFYSNSVSVKLVEPSASTMTIVNAAIKGFNNIFREGFYYRKAGVVLLKISSDKNRQLSLFDNGENKKQTALMKAIDKINSRLGKKAIKLAPQVSKGEWEPRQDYLADKTSEEQIKIYSGMIPPSRVKIKKIDIE